MTTMTASTGRHRADPVNAAKDKGDRPRSTGTRTIDDVASLVGSLFGSLALVWILYYGVFSSSGLVGFTIVWYLVFLAMYAVVTAMSHPRPVVIDRTASALIHGGAVVVGAALFWTVISTFWKGHKAFLHLNFFTHSMAGIAPKDALTKGGILHAIVGSGIELGIATAIALPLGIATAVYMTEVGGRFARATRTVVESMTALPDVLAGLFIYATLISVTHEKSGIAAAAALTVMMIPIIARSADVVLRVVPGGLREAGLALGASHWSTVWRVILPTARPGLATALILGLARAIGETAPVLITSAPSTFFNADPLHQGMNSLPLFVLFAVRSPEQNYIDRGWGAASALLALVLVLFIVTRFLARQRKGSR